jgi:hypothetical protein
LESIFFKKPLIKKGQVLFEMQPKWSLFLPLAAQKKTLLWVQLKKTFGPFYFVRALVNN